VLSGPDLDELAESLLGDKVVAVFPLAWISGRWLELGTADGTTRTVQVSDEAMARPTQVAATKTAAYKVRMPSCYPYTNPVQYRVSWTGNATPAPTPSCKWQVGGGTCTFDPTKDLALSLTWSTPGSYALTVTAVGDDHHRIFQPAPKPTQLNVTVGTGGASAP